MLIPVRENQLTEKLLFQPLFIIELIWPVNAQFEIYLCFKHFYKSYQTFYENLDQCF